MGDLGDIGGLSGVVAFDPSQLITGLAASVAALKAFGAAAIEASNLMDPAGADAWYASVTKLTDGFNTFAGQVGSQLRPILEGLMATLTRVFAVLARMDWGELFSSFAAMGKNVWSALAGLGNKIQGWAQDVAGFLTKPFAYMVQYTEIAVSKLMEALARVQDKLAEHGIGDGGKALHEMADSLQYVSDHAQEDMKINLGAGFSAEFDLFDKLSDGHLKKFADSARAAVDTYGDTSNVKHGLTEEDVSRMGRAQMAEIRDTIKRQQIEVEISAQRMKTAEAAYKLDHQTAAERLGLAGTSYKDADAMALGAQGAGSLGSLRDFAAAQQQRQQALLEEAGLRKQVNEDDFKAMAAASSHYADVLPMLQQQQRLVENLRQGFNDANDRLAAPGQHNPVQDAKDQNTEKQFKAQEAALKTLESQKTASQMAIDAAVAQMKADGVSQDRIDDERKLLEQRAELERKNYTSNAAFGTAQKGLGSAGDVIGAGIKGGLSAGPQGAAIGVLQQLIEMSSTFKQIQTALSGVTQTLANTVGQILAPILMIVQALATPLSALLSALSPIVEALAFVAAAVNPMTAGLLALSVILQPLSAIFGPLVSKLQSLMTVTNPLGPVFDNIGRVVGYLGSSLQRAVQIFNPVGEILQRFSLVFDQTFGPPIQKIGNAIVEIAGIFQSAFYPYLLMFQSALTKVMTVLAGPLNSALELLFDAVKGAGQFVLQVGIGLGNAWNSALSFFSSAVTQMGNGLGGIATVITTVINGLIGVYNDMRGGFQAMVDSLEQEVASALGSTNPIAEALKDAGEALANAYLAPVTGNPFTAVADAAAGLAVNVDPLNTALNALNKMTWGNVSSGGAFGTALNNLTTSLTNAPQAFAVAVAFNQAMQAAQQGGGGLLMPPGTRIGGAGGLTDPTGRHGGTRNLADVVHGRSDSSGGVTITGPVTIQLQGVADPEDFAKQLQVALRTNNLRANRGLGQVPVSRPLRMSIGG